MRILIIALIVWCFTGLALADDVFVGNRPFKGRIYGVGQDVRVSIEDLAKALGLSLQQVGESFRLSDEPIEVFSLDGIYWIELGKLPAQLVKVVRNKELATIDIYGVVKPNSLNEKVESWGGSGSLVAFIDPLEPKTAALDDTLAQFDRFKVVRIVRVDVRDLNSPSYHEYAYLFKGTTLPYFAVLDSHGRKVSSFTGFKNYREIMSSLESSLKL